MSDKMFHPSVVLLVGLYQNESLLAHTVDKTEDFDLFDPVLEPGCHIGWAVLRQMHTTSGVRPTAHLYVSEIAQSMPVDPAMNSLATNELWHVVKHLQSGIKIASHEEIVTFLASAFHAAIVRKLNTLSELDVPERARLSRMLKELSATLDTVVPKASVRKRPLRKEERIKLLQMVPRWTWGIDYWDNAGLNWYIREIHGILGPTGGGKTVNIVNIAVAQIKQGRRVCIALYEQALEEDVTQRIFANLLNVSMDRMRGKSYEEFDEDLKAKMDRIEKETELLLVLDMVGEDAGSGGPTELFGILEQERRENDGWFPHLVIVDWLGEMVTRYKDYKNSDGEKRRWCDTFMSAFNQYKEIPENPCSFLIAHQTNTQAQARPPSYVPSKHDAEEYRAFPNKTDGCCQLGVMDNSKLCWFDPGKSRRSLTSTKIVELDGKLMRFTDVTDEYSMEQGLFVNHDPTAVRSGQQEVIDEQGEDAFG